MPTDVEIRHLLTHTSRIADDADEENGIKKLTEQSYREFISENIFIPFGMESILENIVNFDERIISYHYKGESTLLLV